MARFGYRTRCLFSWKEILNTLTIYLVCTFKRKYIFNCETRKWQEVSSGLNRTFISISSSYLYQIIHINAVMISFFIFLCTGRCCSWYFLGPNNPFWLGELNFLFALYWLGNYCGTKLWKAHRIPGEVPWRRLNLSPTPIHLPRRHSLQWPMGTWTPDCLTNRPGNKPGIRSGLELWFARSDLKIVCGFPDKWWHQLQFQNRG